MPFEKPDERHLNPREKPEQERRHLKKPVIGPGGQTWTEREAQEEIRERREGGPPQQL